MTKRGEKSPPASRKNSAVLKSSWVFVEDLWSLRESYTDVRLICSGGESVSGHQALLSLASPFLKRLFTEEGIREGRRDPEITLLLEETPAEALLDLLQLLYTGKTPAELSPEGRKDLEALGRMLLIPLPPLDQSSREVSLEPTRCIHCGIKFSKLRPLKKHLSTCQRAGATPQLLCLRSCTKPCNKKQHQLPQTPQQVPPSPKEATPTIIEIKEDEKDEPPKVEEEEPLKEEVEEEVSEKKKDEEATTLEKNDTDNDHNNTDDSTKKPEEPKLVSNNSNKRKRSRPEGPPSSRKRGRKDDSSSSTTNTSSTSGEHGCPLCESIYASPSLLREHLCAHFKDELWVIIKGFSTPVSNCAICFKEFRKPVIKNVVVRHYGITHLYIKNYLDAEVFDEYFSGQKKAMERRALKMKKQEPIPLEIKSEEPPKVKALPDKKKALGLFARKSTPQDEGGVIFSLGNEIRGFMDNEEGGANYQGPTTQQQQGPPLYGESRAAMEELYSSESSYDAPPYPCEDPGASRRGSVPYNYSPGDYYPLAPPTSSAPGGEFFQPPGYPQNGPPNSGFSYPQAQQHYFPTGAPAPPPYYPPRVEQQQQPLPDHPVDRIPS